MGIHITMPTIPLGPLTDDSTDEERRNYDDFERHTQWGTGYQYQQSTRPQTLGYGLADSPVGQLAWVVEKFWAWTDCDGDPYRIFTRDQLLDNATVYWMTGTGASSARLYWESAGPAAATNGTALAPGMGVSRFRLAAQSSRKRSADRPVAGRRAASPTFTTGTSPLRAATSRRSNNPRSSSTRSAPRSGHCADDHRRLTHGRTSRTIRPHTRPGPGSCVRGDDP